MTEETRNLLSLALAVNEWLDNAPAEFDIPDRLFERAADLTSEAFDAAKNEGLPVPDNEDDEYFADPRPRLKELLNV